MINLDMMDKIEAFKGLDEDQLKQVRECCDKREFKQGDRLFSEGEEATGLWVMIEGSSDMRFDLPGRPTSNQNTIATITPYQVFGWTCFVSPNIRMLSAYCSTDTCKVLMFEKIRLEKLFKKDTSIGFTFMSYLVNVVGLRFHQLQEEVVKRSGEDIISGW
jgi:CRP-like cAMP-binding protein